MIHDQVASVMSLARNILSGLDYSRELTAVQTKTLQLLLNTLIELGAPKGNQRVAETASRTVFGQMESLNAARESAARVFDAELAAQESAFMVSRDG